MFNTATEVNLMHLSMGGAMVNWKVFEDLHVGLEQDTGRKILNVGSCIVCIQCMECFETVWLLAC